MISEFFLNIIFGLVSSMLELMPEVEWSVDTSWFEYFLDIIRVAGYMLPFETVTHICRMVIALTIVRIVIAIPKAIWDILPLV